ncbi:MAG: cation:proton antiporter [Bacteroidetes bacterium]|nr:cation:proton antiporter [Bacteroidota bacterium]
MLSYLGRFIKQPSIIAYILAGIVIGPIGLGIIKSREAINLFSELGIIFLLFIVGLELDIKKIKKITNETKQDNLPGVDYKYLIETREGKLLKVNSWILWKSISAKLREAGRINATLYLRHNDVEDYTINVI